MLHDVISFLRNIAPRTHHVDRGGLIRWVAAACCWQAWNDHEPPFLTRA
jgi:hypothetical protein